MRLSKYPAATHNIHTSGDRTIVGQSESQAHYLAVLVDFIQVCGSRIIRALITRDVFVECIPGDLRLQTLSGIEVEYMVVHCGGIYTSNTGIFRAEPCV